MDERADLIQKLKEARDKMLVAFSAFPEDKREKILFDKWCLKDVIAHLNGWDQLTVNAIKLFLEGKEPSWASIKTFNKVNVEKRKNWSWKKVYEEFIKSSLENIESYESVPIQKFDSLIWKNRKLTPKKLIKIDINHYVKEHLLEILKHL